MTLTAKALIVSALVILGLLSWSVPAAEGEVQVNSLPVAGANEDLTPRQWLNLIGARTERDAKLLDKIAQCESGWKMVKNSTSSAFGYFQIIDSTERGTPQYKQGERKSDPMTNIEMALYLYYDAGGQAHWNESKGCWGKKL